MKDLSEILTMTAAFETALQQAAEHTRVAEQQANWVKDNTFIGLPGHLVHKLEAAVNNPASLDELRLRDEESALTYVTALFAYLHACEEHRTVIDRLRQMTVELTEIVDGCAATVMPESLKVLIQGLALSGLKEKRHYENRYRPTAGYKSEWAHGIFESAFGKLADDLTRITTQHPTYTIEPVSSCAEAIPGFDRNTELRRIFFVPLQEHLSDQPSSTALLSAYAAVESARKKVRKQVDDLAKSPGEPYHAYQMQIVLHGDRQNREERLSQLVQKQNDARIASESQRLHALINLEPLLAAHKQLIIALVNAASETAQLWKTHNVSDLRRSSIRLAMNNCLAADVFLRETGRELAEFRRKLQDNSSGTNAAAIAHAYQEQFARS